MQLLAGGLFVHFEDSLFEGRLYRVEVDLVVLLVGPSLTKTGVAKLSIGLFSDHSLRRAEYMSNTRFILAVQHANVFKLEEALLVWTVGGVAGDGRARGADSAHRGERGEAIGSHVYNCAV